MDSTKIEAGIALFVYLYTGGSTTILGKMAMRLVRSSVAYDVIIRKLQDKHALLDVFNPTPLWQSSTTVVHPQLLLPPVEPSPLWQDSSTTVANPHEGYFMMMLKERKA